MIYIAAPFWDNDESIRNYRRRKAIEYSERLFNKGIPFYSPLLYSEHFKTRKTKEGYWLSHGIKMVDACDELRILCLDGWEASKGIKGEVVRAESRGIPVVHITRHTRISFHGSRSLTLQQCKTVILAEFEKHTPDTVVTHGEPGGVCDYVRRLSKGNGLALKLHHLQHHRLKGQFHWRSVAVLEDSEYAIFLHDGISQGTVNEMALAKKMGIPFTYYKTEGDKLEIAGIEKVDTKDFTINLLEDQYEKSLPEDVRRSPEYKRFLKAVLERDKSRCVFCNITEGLCVHHLIPYAENSVLALDVSNGQTLCDNCHRGVHGKIQR